MTSTTEENYLKTIFKLAQTAPKNTLISTNSIAEMMETKAASVTDMVKRLAEKELLDYVAYKGVKLSQKGLKVATNLVRKHRLWEVFLFEKLNFSWDEVHPIAEQLEHIRSIDLTNRLDEFLDFPKFDPHGDPIPDKNGNFEAKQGVLLSTLSIDDEGIIVGVNDVSSEFLQYIDSIGLRLGVELKVTQQFSFDNSYEIQLSNEEKRTLSSKALKNLYVKVV